MILLRKRLFEDVINESEYRIRAMNQHCMFISRKIESMCEQMSHTIGLLMGEIKTNQFEASRIDR